LFTLLFIVFSIFLFKYIMKTYFTETKNDFKSFKLPANGGALRKQEGFVSFKVAAKRNIDTKIFHLSLAFDKPEEVLGLPLGHKLMIRIPDPNGEVTESAFPISGIHHQHYLDVYFCFDEITTRFKNALERLKVDDVVDVQAKATNFRYHGLGYFEHSKREPLGKRT